MTSNDTLLSGVLESQLVSLDDTDYYATAWKDALERAKENGSAPQWGGRGKGGRGLARRTFQPRDIVVENVRLEYVGSINSASRVLLEDATLKLLSGKVYTLIGRNGCGKSSLLRRIQAGKIPGFPPHVSTIYIPQELLGDTDPKLSAIDVILQKLHSQTQNSSEALQYRIQQLEDEMETLDLTNEESRERMDDLNDQISLLEDDLETDVSGLRNQVEEALKFWGIDMSCWNRPLKRLSAGLQKKVSLALPVFHRCDLLLLDEPANHLDIHGLLQLRQLIDICQSRGTTVLLISHDVDLINDVATDVIEMAEQSLYYFPGNYHNFLYYKGQNELHSLRQAVALDKKRGAMVQTLENLKKQAAPKRGGAKKKAKQIESQKKKIERTGINKDELGHRRINQKAVTGIKAGSINALDASSRRGIPTEELLRMTEKSITPPPDKAVQFAFRQPTSEWGEPLILAYDVGHGYDIPFSNVVRASPTFDDNVNLMISKKDGYLFDCCDLCIDEGRKYCLLGESACGKSTLLRLLAKKETPIQGEIKYATNVDVAFMDENVVDDMINEGLLNGCEDAISFLSKKYPDRNEKDIRGELTSFGLHPKQAITNLRFLSGGERARLSFAALMLGNPQVLLLDQPTANLDVESVEALIHGLNAWNGTLFVISHDANFVRSIEAECFVLLKEEGKVRRVQHGIDEYLNSYAAK